MARKLRITVLAAAVLLLCLCCVCTAEEAVKKLNPMEAAEAMDPAQVNLAAGTPTTSWRRPRRAGPPACKAINTPMASLPRRW